MKLRKQADTLKMGESHSYDSIYTRWRWCAAVPQWLTHAPDLPVRSYQRLSRPALSLPVALSPADYPNVRPCPICQGESLCQGCQLGTWWPDARDPGIAMARSTTPSTPSVPRVSASTATLKLWALNDPKCAMDSMSRISI